MSLCVSMSTSTTKNTSSDPLLNGAQVVKEGMGAVRLRLVLRHSHGGTGHGSPNKPRRAVRACPSFEGPMLAPVSPTRTSEAAHEASLNFRLTSSSDEAQL